MDRLKQISEELIQKVETSFHRFLFYRITLESQITGIVGPRGVGKSKLILQLVREKYKESSGILYAKVDDIHFSSQSLLDFARVFVSKGGKLLVLDNLHKYPGVVSEMNSIATEFENLKILFASSSAGDNEGAFYDLSRIASLHYLPGLSFREFLDYRYSLSFPVIQMDDLLEFNRIPGAEVLHRIRPLQYFDEYLYEGYFPYANDSQALYSQKVMELVNTVITEDFSAVHRIDYESVLKIHRLLAELAANGPFKPNIEKLADKVGTTRDSLLKFLKYLHKAGLIAWITKGHEDINYSNKPDRLLLNNSALAMALSSSEPAKAILHESFICNQLRLFHQVNLSTKGNYIIDLEYEFILDEIHEKVGKRNNNSKAYTISPNAESGSGNIIPLWMIGFLY